MKRWRLKFFLGALFLLGAAAAVFVWCESRVGRALDTYRGVAVYDNGLLFFRSHGKNYGKDGYYYGHKWQCVEFVKRFYAQAKSHHMPDVMGNARDFFDENLPDGDVNQRRGLRQYRNGSSSKPRVDDLLVFTDTKYGHVGIVTQVESNALEMIQQNVSGQTRRRFSLVTSNGG